MRTLIAATAALFIASLAISAEAKTVNTMQSVYYHYDLAKGWIQDTTDTVKQVRHVRRHNKHVRVAKAKPRPVIAKMAPIPVGLPVIDANANAAIMFTSCVDRSDCGYMKRTLFTPMGRTNGPELEVAKTWPQVLPGTVEKAEETTRKTGRCTSNVSISPNCIVSPQLIAKTKEILAACSGTLIVSARAGRSWPSNHPKGRAVDIRGNASCVYAHLHGWKGGYSTDCLNRACGGMPGGQHVHISYNPGGQEWGYRFVHRSGSRTMHAKRRGHHQQVASASYTPTHNAFIGN